MAKKQDVPEQEEAKSQLPPEKTPTQQTEPSQKQAAGLKFVGTWTSEFYDWKRNEILPPGRFPLIVTQESPETLDGSFPLPGHDAKLWGHLSHEGRLWCGTFRGILQGTFVFILDQDEQSFHGAWVLDDAEGPPQPWWGVRA